MQASKHQYTDHKKYSNQAQWWTRKVDNVHIGALFHGSFRDKHVEGKRLAIKYDVVLCGGSKFAIFVFFL